MTFCLIFALSTLWTLSQVSKYSSTWFLMAAKILWLSWDSSSEDPPTCDFVQSTIISLRQILRNKATVTKVIPMDITTYSS